ncbi:Autophagy-related protein 11 [Seminavis robusta]|uniref:Autophagy-related protein 11 n=1 Tax=Seminavis robusta TaxID=568900 RepID=A0A9N8E553_9STRA|nr:Autophagy-related protein 11 [Seminavis robusta]|eukprot:Sro559_g166530.1 Autophagy-related protein 11 (918) ;mRNA; f:47219-50568
MATQNTQLIRSVRILVAATGVTYKISLPLSDLTVANIQSHLAAAVPPSDQILLLGPPYKVPKDSTLQSEEVLQSLRVGDLEDDPLAAAAESAKAISQGTQASTSSGPITPIHNTILSTTERSGARRLFLFSKQALSQTAPDPPLCSLQPKTLQLPSQAPGQSPLEMSFSAGQSASSSPNSMPPLHQALAAYERQFMLSLGQGRVLADGADMRLRACRQCVQEQAIMARALRAAVSNLSDHYNGAARTRSQFTNTFQHATAKHASLLQRFESILSNLQAIPLHPALVRMARSSGRVMETLLDTVPVEPERAWAAQCQTSHQRLLTLFADLDATFASLGTPAQRDEEARKDLAAEHEIQTAWAQLTSGEVKQIRDRQAERLERLTQDHRAVVDIILRAVGNNNDQQQQLDPWTQQQQQQPAPLSPQTNATVVSDPSNVQNAFGPLQEMSHASKDIVPNMIQDDGKLAHFMETVAASKNRAMKYMQQRLREVSIAQSSIQRVLSSVAVLKDALQTQSENMVHLEHVEQLADSYKQFLSEIRRRRAYGQAVMSSSTAMMERLASMRADEVKAREKFLRGPGRHLMPPFFEMFVPTLATPPPLFTPQLPAMVELDTMPDVGPPESHDQSDATMIPVSTAGEQGVVSTSASTLTAESAAPARRYSATTEDAKMAEDSSKNVASTAGRTAEQQPHDQQQPEQLIVSADDGNDLILGDGEGDTSRRAAEDAERKTLAYENAVLRQALERLGGKPPRAYLDEAAAAAPPVSAPSDVDLAAVAALKKELSETKAAAEAAEKKVDALEKKEAARTSRAIHRENDDRISHSSFSVGDVGLFMPTGRGSGGKRTYLAFHTNCPHRYLSTDNIPGSPDFVLGRIVYQEELIAGEVGTDANPYGLHVGTKFWVLTVEVLNSNLSAAGGTSTS